MTAQAYHVFSSIYRKEADKDLLADLKEKFRPVKPESDDILMGYEELKTFFRKETLNQKLIEQLAADYASLFLGIGKHPAHPYESVYDAEDGLVMGESVRKVRAGYATASLKKAEAFKEPEDHIAVELEFMAFLCRQSNCAIREGDLKGALRLFQSQLDFIDNHLGRWIPCFCEAVIRGSAKYAFYTSVTRILRGFIERESETLSQLIAALLRYKSKEL